MAEVQTIVGLALEVGYRIIRSATAILYCRLTCPCDTKECRFHVGRR